MNAYDNLWEFDIRNDKFITPKKVMRAQAEYLSQMSDGALKVRVETSPGQGVHSGSYVHEFKVKADSYLAYEFTLLEVRQTVDIYPLQIVCEVGDTVVECGDLDEFVAALARVLNDPSTQKRLVALYSQVLDDATDATEGTDGTRADNAVGQPSFSPSLPAHEQAMPESAAPPPTEEILTVAGEEQAGTEPAGESAGEAALARGDMTVAELNKQFQLKLKTTEYPTVHDYICGQVGYVPNVGTQITVPGAILEVKDRSGRRVGKVRVLLEGKQG